MATDVAPAVGGVTYQLDVTSAMPEVRMTTYMNSSDQFNMTTPAPLDLSQYLEHRASMYINLYYIWVVFAVGFPGNIASMVTIVRMPPLSTSTGYVAALAIVDNLNIIVKLLYHQLLLYNVQVGPGGCKFLHFIGTFFMMYANWILVAMSVERFIAIWFPFKVTTLCTGKKAFILMTVIAILLIGIDLQFFWTTTDIVYGINVNCGFKQEHLAFIRYYWYWIDGCLYAIIPCILLVLFNILIIFGIRRSRKIQKDLTNNKSDQMAEKYRQQRQITIMLIVVSVVFVILIIPNCIFFIVKSYWKYTRGSRGHAVFELIQQLIFVLSDANHAVNFYLYFLTARRFRRRFKDTICCRSSSRKPFTSMMRTATSNISNTSIYTTQTSMNGFNRESGNNNSKKYSTTTT